MRIVSLLPSATEIVHALGRGRDLVGRSEECDYPSPVRALPVVMRARTRDRDASSRAIDDRVRRSLDSGESLYELDLSLLRRLAPDVLLTQDLCRVCSVTDGEVKEACRSAGIRPQIVSLAPQRLEEVWRSIETIGKVIGEERRAQELATELRRRSQPAASVPARDARVVVLEWLDPPIVAGLWTPEIVERAGGTCVGIEPGAPGRSTSWAAVAAAAPDLLVLSPCSFTVARTRRDLAEPGLTAALQEVRPRLGTYLADEAYFSRPGPRLADGIDLIRRLLGGNDAGAPMPVERWSAVGEGMRR